MSKYTLENSDVVLRNIHDGIECRTRPCAVHNKTEHSMRGFPQHFRTDNGLMERICSHGIGHPDPDGLPFFEDQGIGGMGIHGCDGCCA